MPFRRYRKPLFNGVLRNFLKVKFFVVVWKPFFISFVTFWKFGRESYGMLDPRIIFICISIVKFNVRDRIGFICLQIGPRIKENLDFTCISLALYFVNLSWKEMMETRGKSIVLFKYIILSPHYWLLTKGKTGQQENLLLVSNKEA